MNHNPEYPFRIGVTVNNNGNRSVQGRLIDDVQRLEAAGFDSIWMSDHLLMPVESTSRYPFRPNGEMNWDRQTPWFDAMIWSTAIAAVTTRVEIGVSALIPTLRNPLALAKQIASLDVLSDGRFVMGAGVGWLKEEFEALGISSARLGARFDEWIRLMRQSWAGRVDEFNGEFFSVNAPIYMQPTPRRDVPILIGGMSERAMVRVVEHSCGWLPLPLPGEDTLTSIEAGVTRIRQLEEAQGIESVKRRIVLNAYDPKLVGAIAQDLADMGVTDIIVEIDLDDEDAPKQAIDDLRS